LQQFCFTLYGRITRANVAPLTRSITQTSILSGASRSHITRPSVRPSVRPCTHPSIHLSMVYSPFVGPWPLFQFLDPIQLVGFLGRGISPSQGRYLHTEQPTIPAFERAKTVHALDCVATVIGTITDYRKLRLWIDLQ
jgi:hypothetical protein